MVALAHTGSGKTLAYLLPLLHRLLLLEEATAGAAGASAGGQSPGMFRALVLVPTKELCQQVGWLPHVVVVDDGVVAGSSYSTAMVSDAMVRRILSAR